ncbi:MAG: serine/threonine protein kinase, partial [Bryobacteraceae bacterium]|nr:serine/threonine protein kinase [Bryobacteraceae bacterium]
MNEDVRVLFRELAGVPPDHREEHYERQQVPAAVRAELESLLSFDATRGNSMNGVVGSAVEQFLLSNAPVSEGGRCGPYRLLRLLGNGGMGAVYLAERADGELDQQVAIKFVRAGADLPSFRERFLRERQILASLNHPGIARLLDAGHSGGHPYLVMEHVDGTRIDEYAAGLDLRSVLELIVRVAEAVSYAHRNLVIHRDLKPSNILVDSEGQPKLLDFGIAKILDATEETCTLDRVLTPEYASPEQLRGSAQATTTDIYSLGAVLYRLLTGQSPHAPGVTAITGVPKDLASILSKAMREEPEERYASVDLLIGDCQAYLEHRPVQARRGTAWYLARKFVRRRWLPMAAATLAVAGLAGGLFVADSERATAQRRFQQVRQLSKQFFDLDTEIRTLPGSTKARNRIVSASLNYLERLGSEARLGRWGAPTEQDMDLALEIGAGYLQLAGMQGVPTDSNLGQFEQAKKSLSR